MANGPDRDYTGARTERRNLAYRLVAKHHQAGSNSQNAQWAKELTDDEEFAVFNFADTNELEQVLGGDMVGLSPMQVRRIAVIGSKGEQIAYFPQSQFPNPWHGFPIDLRDHRKLTVADFVLSKLVVLNLITPVQAGRLRKGKSA